MKVSLNWLQRLLPQLDADIEKISETLTALGLEVEGIEKQGAAFTGLIIGKVLESAKHPDSDHLSVTKLFDGTQELQVVCGAPNVAAGQTVAFAPVGCELPQPDGSTLKLKKVKLRGVDSSGMICGEDEIGLGEDHSGILLLDDQLEAGTPLVQLPGLYDVVIEINVTPDRPDALSHLGVARELGAALGLELCIPALPLREGTETTASRLSITVEPESGCTRYVGRVIENLQVAPSPKWMQRLLHAVGVRSINNVVDITNFVLLEWGQPLHAFDLDKIKSGRLTVRRARAGESVVTLDDQNRVLVESDLLICDGDRPACVAGVMGGAESEVDQQTTRVALESAWFEPTVVRLQSKRLGISSDSSYRFERGIDPFMQRAASDYAAALFAELCGGEVCVGAIDVQLPSHPQTASQLLLRNGQVKRVLGMNPDNDTVEKLLNSIGILTLKREERGTLFELPGWRPDLVREVDLIEEVARLIGYDKIPVCFPSIVIENQPLSKAEQVQRRLRRFLAARGLNEGLSLRFASQANLDSVFAKEDPRRHAVRLLNPLSEEWALLPTSPLPKLMQIVSKNARNRASAVRFFEVAHTFAPAPELATARDPGVVENDRLAMVIAGEWPEGTQMRSVSFFDLKGIIEALFCELGVVAQFRRAQVSPPYAHPHRHAEIVIGGEAVGELAEVHPSLRERFEFDTMPAVFCDIDYAAIVESALPQEQFTPFSRFGAVTRDISLIVDERVDQAEIYAQLLAIDAKNRVGFHFVSSYHGSGVPAGKRNLLYQAVYQLMNGSLTDEEVNREQEKFAAQVAALSGIEVR